MSRGKKKNKKPGLPPGSVVYTGSKEEYEDISIESINFNEKSYKKSKVPCVSDLVVYPNMVNWINLDGVHNTKFIEKIGKRFNIDSVILEDIVNVRQRAKIEERDEFIYIVLKMIKCNEKECTIESEQLSIIVSKEYVLTLQEEEGDVFDPIRERIEKAVGRVRIEGHDYLAYSILDIIVDNYFIAIEQMEKLIDNLEDSLLNTAKKEDLEKILKFKQDFSSLKRAMFPTREIMNKLIHMKDKGIFKDSMRIYLEDVYDHTLLVYEHLENMAGRATGLIELYHSMVNNSMNETMKVLTIMTAIFVPISFLTGVYGMNFSYMPYLDWHYGYYFLLIFMAVIVATMLYFFKRKKWI